MVVVLLGRCGVGDGAPVVRAGAGSGECASTTFEQAGVQGEPGEGEHLVRDPLPRRLHPRQEQGPWFPYI